MKAQAIRNSSIQAYAARVITALENLAGKSIMHFIALMGVVFFIVYFGVILGIPGK